MTIFFVILALLLLVLLGLLFLKLRLIIDSEAERVEVRLIPLARARLLVTTDGDILYRWGVPFYRKEGRLFPLEESASTDTAANKPRASEASEAKKQGERRRPIPDLKSAIRFGTALLPSFKVNRFRWYLNTGDVIWNAWLFPIFHRWKYEGRDVAVRFHGPSLFVLDIENSLYRIIGALIHEYLKPNSSWKPTSKT